MRALTPLATAAFLLSTTLAWGFNVQVNSPVLHEGGSQVYFTVRGGLEQPVQTTVRDETGRKVGMLHQVTNETLSWDGRDIAGRPLNPGHYFIEIESGPYLWSSVVAVDH